MCTVEGTSVGIRVSRAAREGLWFVVTLDIVEGKLVGILRDDRDALSFKTQWKESQVGCFVRVVSHCHALSHVHGGGEVSWNIKRGLRGVVLRCHSRYSRWDVSWIITQASRRESINLVCVFDNNRSMRESQLEYYARIATRCRALSFKTHWRGSQLGYFVRVATRCHALSPCTQLRKTTTSLNKSLATLFSLHSASPSEHLSDLFFLSFRVILLLQARKIQKT